MVQSTTQLYRYTVDADDVVCHVDYWWLAFAAENGAPDLTEATVIGRSLWEFIADRPTRQLYRELHARIRSTGQAIHVPFRCDSPTLRRDMRMTISRGEDGALEYESKLLKTTPQRRLLSLSRTSDRSEAFLTMCSCCKRSLLEPRGWLDMEDIALRLKLYDQQTVPGLRYTLCPHCASMFGRSSEPTTQ